MLHHWHLELGLTMPAFSELYIALLYKLFTCIGSWWRMLHLWPLELGLTMPCHHLVISPLQRLTSFLLELGPGSAYFIFGTLSLACRRLAAIS